MPIISPNEKHEKTLSAALGFFSFVLFLVLLPVNASLAQGYFKFSPQATKAYHATLSLQLDQAKIELQTLQVQEPDNMIGVLIEDYIDFFTIFINEEEEEFKRLEKNKFKRLEKIRDADPYSPYYNYCQAEIYLHWALVRLKFEEYFTTFGEVKNAYRLLKNNQETFPHFVANKKSLGILHALIGTIPENYQWGVKLLGGMEGSIAQGQQEIEAVLEFSKTNDFIFEEETVFMYSLLLLHLKNNIGQAWETISGSSLDPKANPLACFALANVAMRTGRNDQAIDYLTDRPTGDQFAPFPYLNYMLGLTKLYRLDSDAAVYLQKYVDDFKGLNYIKEAYQKMAWSRLIEGDETGYHNYMKQCASFGAAVIGGDKMALREAEAGQAPNPILIKARLLFDGGYYERAASTLEANEVDFLAGEHRLEYLYRLGRIYHLSDQQRQAIKNYKATISEGEDHPAYYACNAALQLGIIYEQAGNVTDARTWFKRCLSIKPKEYRSSLHQKAKAGLNRL